MGGSLYEMLVYADRKKVFINQNGKKTELTPQVYKRIMEQTDPLQDQGFRMEVGLKYTAMIRHHSFTLAKIYMLVVLGTCEDSKIHGYDGTLHMAMVGDHLSAAFYQNLLKFGAKSSLIQTQFLDLKKRFLRREYGLKEFFRTDNALQLAIVKHKQTYNVQQAKDIIKAALEILGEEYLRFLEQAWGPYKIDYFYDTNKRDGAYSVSGADLEPQILMNWDNTWRSVSTLAHEIGHSVHTYFSNHYQSRPLNEYPIIQAEVASTMNEHLLFAYIYPRLKSKKEKIIFLQERIQDLCATFFRQLHFADFECQVHNAVAHDKVLSRDHLEKLFRDLEVKYGITGFDQASSNAAYSWPQILHFFESPFYVYKYAASVLASLAFFQQVTVDHNKQPYLSFLKAGGNQEPLAIFKTAGINFDDSGLYHNFVAYLKALINELKLLLE